MAFITVEMLELVTALPPNMQDDIQSFMEENPREHIYTAEDVINAWLCWNGIIGYTKQITELVLGVYGKICQAKPGHLHIVRG